MRKLQKCDAAERWRDIPGFNGMYQASTEGRIRKILPRSGKVRYLHPYRRQRNKNSNSQALRVHLTMPDGRRVERTVLKLVAETFFQLPEGKIPVHLNGLHTDISVRNITFLTHRELGERYGPQSSRRPVVKIRPDGEIVDSYASARAAARENYLSYQTVIDRCNRKVKKEFALDGFSFRWDD